MRKKIIDAVQSACKELYELDVVVELERPDERFGDYSCNVAMKLAKLLNKNPRDVAQEITEKLSGNEIFDSVGVAGAGFINFILNDKSLITMINYRQETYLSGLKILVEYSDPNPFKPLHAGHLYTTLVGDVIARLVEHSGAEVVRLNYGGDVGLHVAISMWAIVANLGGDFPEKLRDIAEDNRSSWMGERYVEGNNAYEKSGSGEIDIQTKLDIQLLNTVIYDFWKGSNAFGLSPVLKTIVDGEETALDFSKLKEIYKICREWSYEYFEQLYTQLQVHSFDRFIPESEVTDLGLKIVEQELGKGVFEQSDGAIIFDGEKYGLHKRVFINSEGLPTYETKDVGLSLTKWKDYHFDESIIITANEQAQYMQVVIKAIEQFEPEVASKTRHITHGIVKLQGGVKMSSRSGNIVTAIDILDSARQAGQDSGNAHSETIILAAVKYALLKNKIGSDIVYNPEESIALEGNSGPYLQYAHARAMSILAKVDTKTSDIDEVVSLDENERSLVRKLGEFQEIVDLSVRDLAPHHICNYLYELAQNFNRFYEKSKVIGSDRESLRVGLVSKYAKTLKSGLGLLGISAPDKM